MKNEILKDLMPENVILNKTVEALKEELEKANPSPENIKNLVSEFATELITQSAEASKKIEEIKAQMQNTSEENSDKKSNDTQKESSEDLNTSENKASSQNSEKNKASEEKKSDKEKKSNDVTTATETIKALIASMAALQPPSVPSVPSMPSIPAVLPLAVDGDIVIGFDMHVVHTIIPPSPSPVPIGMFPIPFIGTIEVPNDVIVSSNDKKLAYDGLEVKADKIFAHKGCMISGSPLFVEISAPAPVEYPTITLKKNHNKDITHPKGEAIAIGIAKVADCCGTPGQYVIIPSQFLTFL